MKKYIGLLCSLFLMYSCIQMEEVHQDYIEGGEIIYRAKPMGVVGYSGFNRAKLAWKLICPSQVVRCEIMEGDILLAELPVEYQDTVRLECILDELEEKTHTFTIRSFDEVGNASIKSEVIVEVFGTKYQNTLRTNSSLKSVWRKKDNESSVLIQISERTSSKIAGTNVYYLNTAGKEQCCLINELSTTAVLEDVAADSYFKLQDLYLPSVDCIDLIPAPVKEYAVSELPSAGSRSFATAYRLDEKTVYGVLTNAVNGTSKTILTYGNEELVIEPGTNVVTLKNVNVTDVITLKTYIQNEEDGLEYIAPISTCQVADLMTKLGMTNWNVVDVSSEQVGEGDAFYAIDDQLSTFWHTQYSPSQPAYPHYIVVDMKEILSIGGIAIARRQGNFNIASSFLLEVSTDGNTWTSAGRFSIDNTLDGLQIVKLDSSISGRYFRLTGESSATNNTYMCIGEINLFR